MAQVSEQTEDQALVAGLQRRDERAVAALLDAYWTPAYRVALGVCADAAAAEDVAHEGLVRAVQGIESFHEGASLRPWILRIVANLARNRERANSRRDARERAVARPEREEGRDPAAEAALREEVSCVRALLAQLPTQLRETLSLRYLDELSLNEVAGALGCPAGTVSSRIRRGLARLREGLEEAGSSVPKPVAGLGALGALTLLRGVVAPPAASAGQVLSAAANLPALPALLAAPEGAAAAGVGAALGAGAPPPPAPSELLSAAREAAQGAAESAPHAGATLAPLAVVILALALGGGAGSLLLSDPAPTPTRSARTPRVAVASPSGAQQPQSARVELSYRGQLLTPTALRAGDRVTAVAEVRWDPDLDLGYSGEDLRFTAELLHPDGEALTLAPGPGSPEAGRVRWALELSAQAPGSAVLSVRIQRASELVFQEERLIGVRGGQREVRLVHNLTLSGPEGEATLSLDPRVARLESPRRLSLRVIPGFAAEATLSLRGLAHQPTGCFEQTTAATYPSAMVLALGSRSRASQKTLEEARAFALQGSERLRRFQSPRGFSLHPREAADPWLSALGLRQLATLATVIPVDNARIKTAADALLAWQEPDGSFPNGAFVQRRAPKSTLAVSATACEALATYLELPSLEVTPELRDALARGLDWLQTNLQRARGTAERAYVARAFLRGGRAESAQKLLPSFLTSVKTPKEGHAFWEGEWSLTGGHERAAHVEATALVVQVLSGLGERELIGPALAWLTSQRKSRGFGGTQATIQALEAFLRGGIGQAKGQVRLTLGGEELPPFEVGEDLEERVLGRGLADQERLLALARAKGVELRFRGTGTLQLQLVAEGEVPWSTPWGRDGQVRARGAEQLVYEVTRPLQGRVGVPQRWAVLVRNTGRAWCTSPMVELALPPGFALVDPAGREELDKHVELKRLRAWELRGERHLALYLPDLASGQSTRAWVQVVPLVAGDFAGGSLEVYPYYDASGVLASSLPRTEIAPALVIEAGARTPTLTPPGRSQPAAEEAPREEPSTVPSPSSDSTPPLSVAWDERTLGPLDLAQLDLSLGDGPGERLLARALCAYPGVGGQLQETPGASAQVVLQRGSWTDRRPLTVDDYLLGLQAASKRVHEPLPLLAPMVWSPFAAGATPQAGAGRALTWNLPPQLLPLLQSAPFAAARPPARDQRQAFAGPYRPLRLENKRVLRLVPRSEGLRAVDVVSVKRVRPRDFKRYDLVWAQRAPLEDDRVGQGEVEPARTLRPASQRSFWLAVQTRIDSPQVTEQREDVVLLAREYGLPPDLAGLPRAVRAERVTLVLPRAGTLGVPQGALRPFAKSFLKVLKSKGIELRIVTGAAARSADVALIASPNAGGVPLARYDSLLLAGRLEPGATLDHNGFLIWPPRVGTEPSRRRPPALRRR
jgi:RNA polymerase sigma-70 factor, ECF subfamily